MSSSGTHTSSQSLNQAETVQDGNEKAGVAQVVSISASLASELDLSDDVCPLPG